MSWTVKGTCQLLSVGVTVIPGQAGHEMPSSAVDLPITAHSDAQPLQKVDDVHVCPCLCQAPVCVSQAVSEEEEGEEKGERKALVRPSLSLVCPSSSAIRCVPVASVLPPSLRRHQLML